MKLKINKNIVIYLLAGVTIFSVFKYVVSLKEKYDLTTQLNQVKEQASALEKEKQNLLQTLEKEKTWAKKLEQENTGIKGSLRSSEEKVLKLESDFKKTMEQFNIQVTALQTENNSLKLDKEQLNNDLVKVSQEKENLRVKLSSITELKKAIKELKQQMHRVGNEIKVKIHQEQVSEGNRGFVVKDGKPTYPAKVIIEVNPAATQ